jgi:ribonucleoside-diphosphate reductase alpha chain
MTSYSKFQSDNVKYKKNRTDIFNPGFNPTVSSRGVKELDSFTKNLSKYVDFVSWARWNGDLFLDLITPEMGGIRLDLDQRVFLRSILRFVSVYGVFPRGYGKTFVEVLAMYLVSILFPDIEISMSAQTKDNATKLLEEKHREIIKFYPLLANEITKASFPKDAAEIIFASGGRIDVMANNQSSKGARRKRLNCEESNLLNNLLFQDVLEPIVNIPRRTIGKEALVDPEELNGQINFFTTSGFRGSDEFERNIRMIDEMAELKGKIVLGADWQLACEYGRGETKSQLLDKKERLSPIFFAMNYESKWVGCVDDALVDINKLLALRVLSKPELKGDSKSDYYVSMDVSRSNKSSNNQSSIAVLKVKRNKEERIVNIQLVNLINLPNGLNFTGQAIEFKRVYKFYNAKIAICDENGVGKGLLDELLKEQVDPVSGEILECWNTINTDDEPDNKDAKKCLYALHSQGINTEIIVNFIDVVESGKLQLLEKKQNSNYNLDDKDYINNILLPSLNTDFFIEEVANLKLKHMQGGKLSTEQLTKRVDRDRYSAVSYGLWYIKKFEDKVKKRNTNISPSSYFAIANKSARARR